MSSISIFNILAERFTILLKFSMLYNSNLCIIPNLSLKGVVSEPTLVVAPIKVNFGKSILIDFASGPLPIIISNV